MESQITESQIIDSQNHFSQILDIQSHRLIKSKIQKVTKSKVYIVANSKKSRIHKVMDPREGHFFVQDTLCER